MVDCWWHRHVTWVTCLEESSAKATASAGSEGRGSSSVSVRRACPRQAGSTHILNLHVCHVHVESAPVENVCREAAETVVPVSVPHTIALRHHTHGKLSPDMLLTLWWCRCLAAACGHVKSIVLHTRTGGAHVCAPARPGSALLRCRLADGSDKEVLHTDTAVIGMVSVEHLQKCSKVLAVLQLGASSVVATSVPQTQLQTCLVVFERQCAPAR